MHLPSESVSTPESAVTLESLVQWSGRALATSVGEEVVLMNLDRGRCYGLGPVGSDLWKKLGQPIRVADLIERIAEQYSAERDVLVRDVLEVLAQYASEGLLEVTRP